MLLDEGTVVAEGNHLVVRNATAATLLVAVGSDWLGADPAERPTRLLEHASSVGYDSLKQAHVKDLYLAINTQQNYWAAEITGLGECQLPRPPQQLAGRFGARSPGTRRFSSST